MLETTIQEELTSNIYSETKVIYQANGVIYEGQTYSNIFAVVIGYEIDDFKFVKVGGVISAEGKPYIYYKKLLIVGFSHHYYSYEVHESEICGLSIISNLYSYQSLGIYAIKYSDYFLIPLMFDHQNWRGFFLVSCKVSLQFLVVVIKSLALLVLFEKQSSFDTSIIT